MGFELMIPAFERTKTIHASDRAGIVISFIVIYCFCYQIKGDEMGKDMKRNYKGFLHAGMYKRNDKGS
jgi:hypothetical protein